MTENEFFELPKRREKGNKKSGQIYIIKNYINNKVYIGETTMGYENRFLAHCKKSSRFTRNYKLYKAMNNLGVENFYVELLEDNVPINRMYERESFYIKKYNAFYDGYNSTKGGAGRYIDNEKDIKIIIQTYQSGTSTNEIAKYFSVNPVTIVRTLQRYNIPIRSGGNKYSQIDKKAFINLWNDGVVIQDIAKYFSINEKSVRRYVKRFGLPLRGKGFQLNAKHISLRKEEPSLFEEL